MCGFQVLPVYSEGFQDEDDEQGSLDDYGYSDDSGESDSDDYDEDFVEEEVVVPLYKMDFWRTSNVE